MQTSQLKPLWLGSADAQQGCKPVSYGHLAGLCSCATRMQSSQLRPLSWGLLMRHKVQTSQLRPLGWALLLHHKDANQSAKATLAGLLAGLCSCATRMQTSQLRPLGWALLMCYKDANQSVAATWLGSAGAPQGCKPVSSGPLGGRMQASQLRPLGWALLTRYKP